MRIAVSCDHGGYPLKGDILSVIEAGGHQLIDFGTFSDEPVDYPDFVALTAQAVASGEVDRGIVLCGSGVGACITANKFRGVFACLCHDTYSAHQGVEHDDMNVLCLGARIVGPELAKEIVQSFLEAHFSGVDRHVRRVGKIREIEVRNFL